MLDKFRTQKIIWDKANNEIFEKVEANSGDSNGRKLIVQVLNNGMIESLTDCTLSLAWQTKDKAHYGLDAFKAIDIAQGLFEIYYTTGMLSNTGELKASFVLMDSKGRIESKSFEIIVYNSMVDDKAVQSDNSFTALTEALIKVSRYQDQIDDIKEDIINQGDTLISTEQEKLDNLYTEKESKLDTLHQDKLDVLNNLHDTEKNELDTLEQDYADKATNLETTYAPRLTAVENMEIGGRNLLLNSSFSDNLDHWTGVGTIVNNSLEIIGTSNATRKKQIVNVQPSTQYTFSIDLIDQTDTSSFRVFLQEHKADGAYTAVYEDNAKGFSNIGRNYYTITTQPDCAILYVLLQANNTKFIHVRNAKLEKGNKPTDWTPAPEDVQAEINKKANQNNLLKIVDYINNIGSFNGGYSWWVYPNILKHNNKTYMTYVNNAGETIIASYDHEGAGKQSCVLQTDTVSDEHNTGAIAVMNDDKIIVAYAKHNKENIIRIKISKYPNNIEYFEDAIELSTSGKVTYAQLFKMDNGIFRLYYRVDTNSWAYRTSSDGITWSSEQIFLNAPEQYYIRGVKRQHQVRFIAIGHPILSNDNDFKYFYDTAGTFYTVGGQLTKPFTPNELYTIKTPSLGNARLFDISTLDGDVTFAYADFTDENNAVYKVATGSSSSGWDDKIICQGGSPLEYPLGANYYFGGMWFEWNSNKIVYVARENNGTWYIEKYQTDDFTSWELVEEINTSDNEKLHRPVIPYNGGSLVYQKGDYQDYRHYNSKVISEDWFISL